MMSEARTQVMVPGILVALKTSVRGGVEYQQVPIEEDEDGKVKRWETTRIMDDPEERKAAGEISGKASTIIARLCVRTNFGMLCRTDREAELDAAVIEARQMVREFNQKARYSFVHVSAIKGRIADNDEDAIRAICDEARDILNEMDLALSNDNVKLIQASAQRAKKLTEMMTDDSSTQLNAALTAARKAAREITKRGEDLSDKVAKVKIEVDKEAFTKARFSFLETAAEVTGEPIPAVDLQRFAELEIA